MPKAPVVVAVDFSPASISALRWCAAHLAAGADVIAVHAVDIPAPPTFLAPLLAPVEPVREAAVDGARARLAVLSGTLPGTQGEVRPGPAAAVVLAVAAERHASVIVVGPHGSRSGLGRLLGSTAAPLAREASCPVVVARDTIDRAPVRVLVAVDDTVSGPAALAWAVRFASEPGRELIALHVVNSMLSGAVGIGAAPHERRSALDGLRRESVRWLDEQLEHSGLAGEARHTDVRFGDPVSEILAACVAHNADLLVIGRSQSGLPSVIGSVADALLRSARVVTVVVPVVVP